MLKKHVSSKRLVKETKAANRSFPKPPRNAAEPAVEKVVPKKELTFEDLKQQLESWAVNEKIPGKFQAWFGEDSAQVADWRLITQMKAGHEQLTLDKPAKNLEVPEIVTRVNEQLHKDHLRLFRKSLRQIWFRAYGDGQYAMLVQANLRGRNSAHGYKTFVDFVQRSCPEIASCHHIQCTPDHIFDPSAKIQMRVDARAAFGKDFMPIANTGFYMHVLDWSPRIRDNWAKLPVRIADAIHPKREDKFFEFYSGSTFVGASLAGLFQQVDSLDCRESAQQSTRYNSGFLANNNLKFHRSHLDDSFFGKFFSREQNEGRWTFYFNLPEEETLPSGVVQMATSSRPERILLQTGDLEVAAKTIRQFRREDYLLRKSIPLYLEPGRSKIEVLFIFVPDRAGLLGMNGALKNKSRTVQKPRESVQKVQNPRNQGNLAQFAKDIPSFKQRKD